MIFNRNGDKIIYDTREKKNKHIIDIYNKNNIEVERKKLEFGDYTFKSLENLISIERKSGLNEFTTNATKKREQFKNELDRAAEVGAKMILLIENSTQDDIIKHNYRSKMHPNSLIGTLRSWKEKYNLEVYFLKNNKYSAEVIYYFLKTYSKKNKSII